MIKRLPNPTRWASIPAAALEDARLSWKARGLLAFILAKPDDWEIRREQLIASSDHDGIRSVKGALKELVDLGYAELVTARSADGRHLAGQRYNVSDQAETFRLQNVSVTKRFGNETAPVTNISEETKDQEKDYRPKRGENARAKNDILLEKGFEENHGCMLYHPGLPCEHEQDVLSAVRGVLWPTRTALPKSHPNVQGFAHRYDAEADRVDAAVRLAEWWKQTRKPKDWTIPLMFADPETELANAQGTQKTGMETALQRYARKLEEQNNATS